MKKVLIISPYFPPVNAADMQRVRMSLPFFKKYGWDAEVVTVDEKYSDYVQDNLLMQSVPADIKVHKIKALKKNLTKKIGLGNIAMRSLWFYRQKVNLLLANEKYDLIYFSTTQFPVCVLGAYWKKKFNIPYVIDMQDPWYSGHYKNRPKNERPPMYTIVYWLHKRLEAIAIKKVDGLISVSESYLQTLRLCYPNVIKIPSAVITFGAFEKDFDIARQQSELIKSTAFDNYKNFFNCVYVGRGGYDMEQAITLLFNGFKLGLQKKPQLFSNIRFHFLGTSYAPEGEGKPSVMPLAQKMDIAAFVNEQTNRLPFYKSIATLLNADALIIPGSDSPEYTASKIFPYIMAKKPLLAVFRKESSAVKIIRECSPLSTVVTFPDSSGSPEIEVYNKLEQWLTNKPVEGSCNTDVFKSFSADEMTNKQVKLFNRVVADR